MPGEEMTPEELEAVVREMEERALDERIVAALESRPDPEISIPADFAARVAEKVPAKRVIPVSTTHYGQKAMWGTLVLLFVGLVVTAANGFGRSTVGSVIEWLLCAQFLALVVWLGVRRWSVD